MTDVPKVRPFTKEELEGPLYADLLKEVDGFTVVERRHIEDRRWYAIWRMVFEKDRKFYRVDYLVPATEDQSDIEPFEIHDDPVLAIEVVPVQQLMTVYNDIPDCRAHVGPPNNACDRCGNLPWNHGHVETSDGTVTPWDAPIVGKWLATNEITADRAAALLRLAAEAGA